MIVRDDSERGIPPLVTHQRRPRWMMRGDPRTDGADPRLDYPAVRRIIYRARLVWRRAVASPGTPQTLPLPVAHAALLPLTAAGEAAPKTPPPAAKASAPAAPEVNSDTLPPLRYSAHVYASRPEKRSIVLNGKAWTEGDSPLPNLVVEQIQQDVTIFSFNGTTFTLAALEDWPGGKIDEEPKEE